MLLGAAIGVLKETVAGTVQPASRIARRTAANRAIRVIVLGANALDDAVIKPPIPPGPG
jgi:ATP-dependent helicase YprA (DUF1998 family)